MRTQPLPNYHASTNARACIYFRTYASDPASQAIASDYISGRPLSGYNSSDVEQVHSHPKPCSYSVFKKEYFLLPSATPVQWIHSQVTGMVHRLWRYQRKYWYNGTVHYDIEFKCRTALQKDITTVLTLVAQVPSPKCSSHSACPQFAMHAAFFYYLKLDPNSKLVLCEKRILLQK
eukprot:6210977-Pleurochrysis_carterae.AAC.1